MFKAGKITAAIFAIGSVVAASLVAATPAQARGCDYSAPRSATQNGEVFLGGKYLELGISALGDFGTVADGPTCFVPRNNGETGLGMSTDVDGFGIGDENVIDYFLPGAPEERFSLGITPDGADPLAISTSQRMGGISGYGDISRANDFVALNTTVTNTSTGNVLSARVVTHYFFADGTTALATLTQNISFAVNDHYFINNVTIKNDSSGDFSDVRYVRNFDPDNAVDFGGVPYFPTNNDIVSTIDTDERAVVRAKYDTPIQIGSTLTQAPIMLYSADADAVAGYGGFTSVDPYNMPTTGSAKGDANFDDIAIFMGFNKGALAAGASVSLKYVTSLDTRYFYEINEELSLALDVPINLMIVDPRISNILATSARLTYNSTGDATGHVLVLPSADAAPTAAEVVAGGVSAAIVNGSNSVDLTGLTEGTAYKAYIVGTSGSTTSSVTVSPEFTPSVPPTVTALSVSSITQSSAQLNFTSSLDGSVRYIVQLASTAAPTLAQVLAQSSSSVTAGANNIAIGDLNAKREYKVYFAVQNATGNPSALQTTSAFTTMAYTYTLTYHYGDDVVATKYRASSTWSTGDNAIVLSSPSRKSYRFVGWYSDEGLNNAVTGPITPTENADLYAKWETATASAPTVVATVTVSMDANLPTKIDPVVQTSSGMTELVANKFARRGYAFAGWNTKADGSGVTYLDKASYPFAANATIYAQWTALPFAQKVGGFANAQSTLTAAQQVKIASWSASIADGASIKCVAAIAKAGATAAEVAASKLRAQAVCDYLTSVRTELTVKIGSFKTSAKGAASRYVSVKLG